MNSLASRNAVVIHLNSVAVEIRARGEGGLPPKRDVNLFNVRAGGRGVCGDVAVQGLIPGSASVFLFVCLFVCGLVRTGFGGWSGSEFRGKNRTKRFRRARSTFSSVEVGSDSLILGVWMALLC